MSKVSCCYPNILNSAKAIPCRVAFRGQTGCHFWHKWTIFPHDSDHSYMQVFGEDAGATSTLQDSETDGLFSIMKRCVP